VLDAIVVGAGPAGSVTALVLARAGARVLLLDRETFPRDKLCGDTINPGALSLLDSLGLSGGPIARAQPLAGMILSGPRVSVRTEYGRGIVGRSVRRRELDLWLLEQAIEAGTRFESGVIARHPLVVGGGAFPSVRGLAIASRGRPSAISRLPARLVIAADGTRSSLARGLGLLRTPARPRRWAFGAYVAGIDGLGGLGEMHVRPPAYVGIAPLGDSLANVCVVTGPHPGGRAPLDVMRRVVESDAALAARFRAATFVERPRVLGPLAAEASGAGVEGLLLAGDAAGFVDPLTGDGLHLALRGAVLAAQEALRTLESSDFAGAPRRLAEARRATLGTKLRFNQLVRRVVGSPLAVALASQSASLAPGLIRPLVRYAGDVGRAHAPTGQR
jgi:flavin-dependent dehydrogenase